MESDASDVRSMSFKTHHRVWVGRFDVIQADHMTASGGEVFLVWCDA